MERVEYEKLIIQDLLNFYMNNELNLAPWYQRRSVWTFPQKAYLLNTLFEQKPVPTIYIRHSLDYDASKSIKEVVDGQQRIRSIIEFVDNQFASWHPSNQQKKVKYADLSRPDQIKFKLTSLSVGYLLGATDEDVIQIFGRLNSVAKTLNHQEKRNATFSGDFKRFCLNQASMRLPLWRNLDIFSANDISRMQEVEFVSELALNFIEGTSDYSSKKLDDIYRKFDESFPQQNNVENRFDRVFNMISSLDPSSIKDTIFSRQPLFFTLCCVLDSFSKLPNAKQIDKAIHRIDDIYSSDKPPADRPEEENSFIAACTSSTQRIKNRRIREAFIKKQITK